MSLTEKTKNRAANAIIVAEISLHSGPPGVNGAANELPTAGGIYARKPIAFDAADNGVRDQSADVLHDVPAGSDVSHYVIWDEEGDAAKVGAYASAESFAAQGQFRTRQGTLTITG